MPKTNKSVCMKTLRNIAEDSSQTTENRLDAVRMLLSMDNKQSTRPRTSKRTQGSNASELREALGK